VATANDISKLPAELLRKGRLDEIFFVDLAAESEREEIFTDSSPQKGRSPRYFDLAPPVAASNDFSGAEIEEAINSALYDAFYSNSELATQHILTSLKETVPLSRTMNEQIQALRSWAEGRARNASIPRAEIQRDPERRRDGVLSSGVGFLKIPREGLAVARSDSPEPILWVPFVLLLRL